MTLLTITARELQSAAKEEQRAKWKADHARRTKLAAEHVPPPHPPKQGPKKRRAQIVKVCPSSPEQRERWERAAADAGVSLSEWLRAAGDGPTEAALDEAASLVATFGAEQHRRGVEGEPTTADIRARALTERIVRVLRGAGS